MKTLSTKMLALSAIAAGALMLASCGPAMEEKSKYTEGAMPVKFADSVSGPIRSKAPQVLTHDTAHAFIRKADISFQVKDVRKSTYQIEDIVSAHHGYVTLTDLASHVSSKQSVRLSADTMVDLINYKVENMLTIRVPNNELDATLKDMASLIDFLDYRKITASDVKFQLLANKLSEARFAEHKRRFESAIDRQGKKLPQTTEAENELMAKQESADDTRIETMELLDEVHYSTVTLKVYQPETQRVDRYAYLAPVKPYEPGFGSRLLSALSEGGHIFGEIMIFILRLWPLMLLGGGIWLVVRWISKRRWAGQS